ncbi:MFS transporter [Bombilactobacillus folatiphilus]|uniref:MFS transporter n=1 Tax=Bombilactobacillus folatiphilus TaxID=2923362 RepID=A0ABY4P833_9LACO|nr:MFS transporter [Bombilactobacillus folatiphilus]UQS81797.1 MFS transporter [Bombilactobacillus folatiphilus]
MKRAQTIDLKWLLLGTLVTSIAMSFIWPLNTIYMHETLHQSLVTAAIVLCINQIATMLGNLVGGRLFDHWDPYYTMLLGVSMSVVALGGLILWHGWPSYAVLITLAGFANGISATCENSFATHVTKRPASYVFNATYFMLNLGIVIGTAVVGYILPLGIQVVFAVAVLTQIVFLFVVYRFYRIQISTAKNQNAKASTRPRGYELKILGALIAVLCAWLVYTQWQSNLSTFMVSQGYQVKDYSLLWTFNAIVIVIYQPFITHFDHFLMTHLRARLNVGLILFIGSFVFLLGNRQYIGYFVAMGILTLGEILLYPGISSWVAAKTPPQMSGYFQSQVQMFTAAGKALGPIFGAVVISQLNYHWLFALCIVVLIVAFGCFNVISNHWRKNK